MKTSRWRTSLAKLGVLWRAVLLQINWEPPKRRLKGRHSDKRPALMTRNQQIAALMEETFNSWQKTRTPRRKIPAVQDEIIKRRRKTYTKSVKLGKPVILNKIWWNITKSLDYLFAIVSVVHIGTCIWFKRSCKAHECLMSCFSVTKLSFICILFAPYTSNRKYYQRDYDTFRDGAMRTTMWNSYVRVFTNSLVQNTASLFGYYDFKHFDGGLISGVKKNTLM